MLGTTARTGHDANAREDCRIVGDVNSIQKLLVASRAGRDYTIATDGVLHRLDRHRLRHRPRPTSARSTAPSTRKVYIDLGFFDELRTRFGAQGGPLAEAYVLAHEYGHHVQDMLGRSSAAAPAQQGAQGRSVRDGAAGRLLRRRLGAPRHADRLHRRLRPQADVADALDAAAAVGDDRIQAETQGQVNPETWTHGSSAEREHWFTAGYRTGEPASLRHLQRHAVLGATAARARAGRARRARAAGRRSGSRGRPRRSCRSRAARPSSDCSISTAPTRARRTAAARRRTTPWTTKSFSAVRTTCVRSQRQTAAIATAAATTSRTAPATDAGQPTANPTRRAARARAHAPSGRTSTIAVAARVEVDVLVGSAEHGVAGFDGAGKNPGHGHNCSARGDRHARRRRDRRGARSRSGRSRSSSPCSSSASSSRRRCGRASTGSRSAPRPPRAPACSSTTSCSLGLVALVLWLVVPARDRRRCSRRSARADHVGAAQAGGEALDRDQARRSSSASRSG